MALSFCGRRLLLTRTSLLSTYRNNGYIILIPEIGEDLPEKNPLSHQDGLPEFNNLTIENCMASIAKQTLEFEAGVKNIERTLTENPTTDIFKDVFDPLEHLGAPLDLTWGLSKTLYLGNSSLMPTKSYLSIHDRAKRARAAKFNSTIIYDSVKSKLEENDNLTEEESRILKKYALEGKLNGLQLSDSKKALLRQHLSKLVTDRAEFKRKIDLSTKQFNHTIHDNTTVRDFPPDLLKATSTNPENYLQGPWKINLQPNIYTGFMEHCPDRDIRWNLWLAYVGRGSGYGMKDLANSSQLEGIRYARRDIANLVGYETFADMSMETKMAGSVENVFNTIRTLLERAKPNQELELQSLYEFALERGFKGARIELWDLPYWRRKQQVTLFNYTEEAFKNYFPLPKVLDGLFQLTEKLFNIVIKQRNNVSTWHKDVRFYDIFEPHSSAPVAGFYLDPYASDDKLRMQQNNGWIVGIQTQSRLTETKPLAALVFNFEPPTSEKQSYLTFNEVEKVFHKFGQALQHLLTRTNYSEVSGSSNIEWDAVEVSGHVLCHWLHNKQTIDSISSHCASEDSLPQQMFENLVHVHKHLAGIDLCKELYLGALDLELHSSKDYWLDVVRRLWPEFRSFPLDKYDSHPCSFTPIFTEEWGAAYYSNIWSRMIAADVYSAFHEVQENERQVIDVGRRFKDTFLTLGGSCHPSEVFRRFRGRDPSPKALLSSLGLKKLNAGTSCN